MTKFTVGLALGLVLSTVGFNGIVKLSDNALNNFQKFTIESTYPGTMEGTE
jgi:hypothetical protein